MRRGITLKGLVSAFTMSALFFVPLGLWGFGVKPPGVARAEVPPPALSVIQAMSDLATTRVHVSDFIEGENAHWKGKWILHGEAVLGVDLSKVTYIEANPEKKEAVLSLPQPHLITSKVDHNGSDEVYLKSKVWLPLSNWESLRAEVWKHADRKIQKLGEQADHMERARTQAERVLHDLFKGAGWTVRFQWKGKPRSAAPPVQEEQAAGFHWAGKPPSY